MSFSGLYVVVAALLSYWSSNNAVSHLASSLATAVTN